MIKNPTGLYSGSMLCLISLILIGWLVWPVKMKSQELHTKPVNLETNEFADLPEFDLKLESAAFIRLGDSAKVTLKVKPNERKIPTEAPNRSQGLRNLDPLSENNQGFTEMAVARLELEGAFIDPAGFSGKVISDQEITFDWEIRLLKTGYLEGTAWFYIQMFPSNGSEMVEIPISVQTLEINVISIGEIKSNTWRVISGIGMLTGILTLGISITLKKQPHPFK